MLLSFAIYAAERREKYMYEWIRIGSAGLVGEKCIVINKKRQHMDVFGWFFCWNCVKYGENLSNCEGDKCDD